MRQVARQTEGANVRYVDQMYFANKLGNEAVKKILPANPAQTEASIIRDATMENLAMGQMADILVDSMDKHSVHIPIHIQVLEQIADSAEQGQDISPDQLLVISPISQHTEAHLNFMSLDTTRVEEFKVLNKRYNIVSQRLTAILNQAVSQQAAANAGQALTKEDLVSLKKLAESMIPTLKGSIQNVENQRIKHAHKKPAIRDSFNEKIDTHIKNYEGHIEFLSKYL